MEIGDTQNFVDQPTCLDLFLFYLLPNKNVKPGIEHWRHLAGSL